MPAVRQSGRHAFTVVPSRLVVGWQDRSGRPQLFAAPGVQPRRQAVVAPSGVTQTLFALPFVPQSVSALHDLVQ